MRKFKYVAGVLVLSTVLMGAGYAAWTDKITLSSSVTTGNLNVEFVKQDFSFNPLQPEFPTIVSGNINYLGKCYATATINQDNSKLTTVQISNLYPGATAWTDFKVKNTGTIPAKIKDIDVKFTQTSDALKRQLIVWGTYVIYNSNGIPKYDQPGYSGAFLSTLGDFESTISPLLENKVLDKNEFITFDITDVPDEVKAELQKKLDVYGLTIPSNDNCIHFILPNIADNSTEDQTAKFDMEINFKQFNK
ncbi:hypothetical protein HMPREF1982_02642 [Clostridiales bacterium oral taxon 876 str. F0540]|nr:hypothetical protein HMPREF1982_02642 [Clostridiales bacterium oral taxon 876 str. F0540]